MPVVNSLSDVSDETLQSIHKLLNTSIDNLAEHFRSGMYLFRTSDATLPYPQNEEGFRRAAQENAYEACALGILYVANAGIVAGGGKDVKWHARCLLDQVASELYPFAATSESVSLRDYSHEGTNDGITFSGDIARWRTGTRHYYYGWSVWGIEAIAERNPPTSPDFSTEEDRKKRVLIVYKEAARRVKLMIATRKEIKK